MTQFNGRWIIALLVCLGMLLMVSCTAVGPTESAAPEGGEEDETIKIGFLAAVNRRGGIPR